MKISFQLTRIKIRKATIEEATEIAKLHIEAERETYGSIIPCLLENVSDFCSRTRLWRHVLLKDLSHILVMLAMEESGQLVGFLSGNLPWNTDTARLNAIYILKHRQLFGIGSRLLAAFAGELLSQGAQTLACAVPEDNAQIREFISQSGGLTLGEDESYSSIYPTRMIKFEWNDVEQLVNHFRILNLSGL